MLQVILNCNSLAIVMVGERDNRGGEAAARIDEAARDDAAREPVIDAAQLMRGKRAIGIRHHGEIYRLRVTSKDKLILTK
jgi:hemin uptake protein HemP